MAKNTQEAEVIVTMNGQAAKKAVAELAQEYQRLKNEALAAYKAGDEALGKKLDAQAQKLTKDIEITRRETKKFADIMKNLNGASLKELNSAAKQLRSEINKLTPGTQEFITKSKQLQEVNTRINQLKGSFKGLVAEEKAATVSLKGLSEGFNRYFGMITAGIAAITGVSMALKKCAQDAAAMDDAYATVMKTTSLTHEEVEQLNEAFKKMDTRTAREELNKMAYEAGKLGFTGVENIRQFVEAADVINVALGDVLGEGATLEIAKLAQVFAQSTAALDNLDLKGRMLAVGSAVNQLGKESTASESYMVDFLGRLGGVATQAGISADQILGYASALDQMKQKVEMSATAFQKLIQQMIKKPEEFVEAARMPLDEFTKMMETDMNGAIKRVLEGFNEMGGFTQLVPVFKDMGLDGARAASVIASLAANLDKVSAAQATANEHIRLGTSMTREYNIMNSSMQARLEKARKEFKDICVELGQKLNPIMLKSTKATTYLIKVLATYGKEIRNVLITMAALTVAVKASTIAHTVYHAVVKGITAIQGTFTVAMKAASVAINVLRGRTEAATKAYLAMKAAMSTSVFGAIATAASALVLVITRLINKEKEAANAMTYVQSVEKKVVETYAEEEARLKTLHTIVRDNTISLDQRRKALEELQEIVPEYHASLDKEGKLIEGNTVFLDKYIEKLREATRWQVYKDEWQDLETQLVNIQDKIAAAKQAAQEELIRNGGNNTEKTTMVVDTWGGGTKVQETYTKYGQLMRTVRFYEEQETELLNKQEEIRGRMQKLTRDETTELTAQQKEIKAIEEKYRILAEEIKGDISISPAEGAKKLGELYRKMQEEIAEVNKKYANPNLNEDPDDDDDETPSGETPYQKALKDLEKAQREEENLLRQKYIDSKGQYEDFEKDMREINLKYLQEKVELAKEYGEDETSAVSAWLSAQITATDLANKEIDALLKQREDWEKAQQAELEAYQKQLEEMKEEAEKVKDWLDPSAARVKEMNDELAALDKLHQAKLLSEEEYERAVKKLRKQYADEDLAEKIANAQKFADQLNNILTEASNVVSSIKDAELAKAEATYQAELTAAGNNAAKRQAVEENYQKKQLDIQKKYADIDMVMKIAKTTAAGAVAAIRAYEEGGPYAGPFLAAAIAATTAYEIATIIQQRNAIKSASVNTSGSSNYSNTDTGASSGNIGSRVITGYKEGGSTKKSASDNTPAGIVHANEWVAPAWLVRSMPIVFANLERYRRAGSQGRSGSMARGFADGGFTSSGLPSGTDPTNRELVELLRESRETNELLRAQLAQGIKADVALSEIDRKKKMLNNFKKKTSAV